VVAFVHENAVLQRLRGHSSMFPSVIVTQKSLTQNDSYVVVGIDSVDVNSTPGYTLSDSSTGSVIMQRVPLTETEFLGYGSSPVDGFKVNWGGAYARVLTAMAPIYTSSDTGGFPWFSTRSPNDPSFLYLGLQFNNGMNGATGSTISSDDVKSVQLRFSKMSGYTDVNANGVYDIGEPYTFDTLNSVRSQRAYFYRRDNVYAPFQFAGYLNVPFAAFDMTTTSPRQLSLVVLDKDKNNQWDPDLNSPGGVSNNYIYVLADTYDPAGIAYDSAKGGVSLGNALTHHLPIPSYYALWIMTDGIHQPLGAAGECTFNPLIPVTSLDEWVFNPTTTTGVSPAQVPARFALQQSYPNPFNPSATILYSLEKQVYVRLVIYNVLGQRIKALVDAKQVAGTHSVVWDGTDYSGHRVASGIYFYRLEAGSFVAAKKMVMTK